MVGSEFSAFYFEGSPVLFGDKIFQSRQPLCFFLNIPSLQLVFNPKTPKNILLIYFMTLIICKGPRDLFAITKVSFWPYLTWKISPLVVYFLPKTFNVFKSVTAIDLNHSSYMLVHWKNYWRNYISSREPFTLETVGAAGWPFWNKFQHFLFSLLASVDQVFAPTKINWGAAIWSESYQFAVIAIFVNLSQTF